MRHDLAEALKARDGVAVDALRSALSALGNAEAVGVRESPTGAQPVSEHFAGAVAGLGATEVPRRRLTDAEVDAIVAAEVADRLNAAADADRSGHPVHARRLRAEAQVLSRYLPPPPS